MLITILCLIGLVVVAMLAIRLFGQDSSASSQRRQKRRHEPTLQNAASDSVDRASSDSEDPDEVLGLKSQVSSLIQEDQPKQQAKPAQPKLIAFYLVAKAECEFSGYDLLQAILSTGFRYGDMQIFHRHVERSGKGSVLFSLSAISEPGTFDLPNIGGFSCRGLTLFMQYDQISDPVHSLDLMVDAAVQLQEELGGHLLAGDRQPLDDTTIKHYRQQIEQFVLQHTEDM